MRGPTGRPLAAAVIFELFAVPLLARLQDSRVDRDRRPLHAWPGCHWSSPPDVEA